MRARPHHLFLVLALPGLAASCGLDNLVSPSSDDPDDGVIPDTPPDQPAVPTPAIYKRGSLTPLFELTPSVEQGRFDILGVRLEDADFTTNNDGFFTLAQKMDEVAAQIGAERGAAVTIVRQSDRLRAQAMPFRGNPSDIELLAVGNLDKAYVPLGGDMGTPGNEVAAVDLANGAVTRVRVGIRPVRVASAGDLVFVCNQYSNYVSIIDPERDELLVGGDGLPVEIATEYYCTDLALVPATPGLDDDRFDLYLANSWRSSVLRYRIQIERDPLDDRPSAVRIIEPASADPISTPAVEIRGVGANPSRLSVSQDQGFVYVANIRGGEVARIARNGDAVTRRVAVNGPTNDIINIGDRVFIPTTTIDRGLLDVDEPRPTDIESNPVTVTGLDGNPATAHPGSMFDRTRSYNFEDLRNGVVQLDSVLTAGSLRYMTDDISPEPNFVAQQRILTGAVPVAVARNLAGSRVFLAHSSSDQVQELQVVGGAFGLQPVAGGTFATSSRPWAIAVDDGNDRLVVATWGGEVLEVFDLGGRNLIDRIDLGYANLAVAPYPATNIEQGQEFFWRADWSNNGRKACTSCHVDELQVDGIGYSNGATAPTAYHQVRPNWNLMTTDNYFWNGSFKNGSYASLAFLAQSRTNCELITFGFVEGPGSDPAQRVGDPNNRVTDGQDALCRPDEVVGGLPANFDQIAQVIAAQKLVANQLILDETGVTRDEVTRLIDFYSVSQLRLPPNPLQQLYEDAQLDSATMAKVAAGGELFRVAGCANCHDPDNSRAPFTDGRQHGSGADWEQRFVARYSEDDRVVLPPELIDSLGDSQADPEINVHLLTDDFRPFCFDSEECLIFEDPLGAVGNVTEETRRLDLLSLINLDDPERGFVPGNVVGQPKINTPSLRGVWWQPNILHHGLANTVAEAVLAPGHPALREGEEGWAMNALGQTDVHGQTSGFSAEEVEALGLFVESIP